MNTDVENKLLTSYHWLCVHWRANQRLSIYQHKYVPIGGHNGTHRESSSNKKTNRNPFRSRNAEHCKPCHQNNIGQIRKRTTNHQTPNTIVVALLSDTATPTRLMCVCACVCLPACRSVCVCVEEAILNRLRSTEINTCARMLYNVEILTHNSDQLLNPSLSSDSTSM